MKYKWSQYDGILAFALIGKGSGTEVNPSSLYVVRIGHYGGHQVLDKNTIWA
jgi:hypothetical protein